MPFRYIKVRTRPLSGFDSLDEENHFFRYHSLIITNGIKIYAYQYRMYMRELIHPDNKDMQQTIKTWRN
jgi:hypothetical protein